MNEAMEQFLKAHHQVVIGTTRKDGSPHLSNVLAIYEDGKFLISITETRVKYGHLRRDPRASLIILGDNFFQYAAVEGRASFTHMPEARIPLREYFEKASGKPHPNWEEYDAAMAEERRVLLQLSIDKIRGFNVG